jgi:hypothetical protein
MTIAAVILFAGIGLYCIIRRHEAAKGFGMTMGARFPVGCMVMFGVGFFLIAIGFIVLYMQGVLGE